MFDHEDTCRHYWALSAPPSSNDDLQLLSHLCRRDAGHEGEHVCSCGARVDQ